MIILEKQEHEIYAKKEKKSQNFTTQRKLSTVIFLASLMSSKCILVFYGTEVCGGTSNSAVCFSLHMLLC